MSNKIQHSGIIETIDKDCVHVRILQSSACSSCKISGHCSASESKEKVIDIYERNASNYHVGENVTIFTDGNVGAMAVVYAYVLPFVLMIGALVLALAITSSELQAALWALASLIPYYIIIYLLRDKISRQVYFNIEKKL